MIDRTLSCQRFPGWLALLVGLLMSNVGRSLDPASAADTPMAPVGAGPMAALAPFLDPPPPTPVTSTPFKVLDDSPPAEMADDSVGVPDPVEFWTGATPRIGLSDGVNEGRGSLGDRMSFFGAAHESLFGDVDARPWRPLRLGTFFTKGWLEPWARPPSGDSGATRQGWIGAVDGNFYRLFYLTYGENFHSAQGNNGYATHFDIYTPLSRRLLLLTTVPYVNSNSPSLNLGNINFNNSGTFIGGAVGKQTSFGDLTLTPRVLLSESRNLSLAFQLPVQIPTGRTDSGAGRAILSPGLHFWSDVGRGWAVRGGFNVSEGLNKVAAGATLTSQIAVGQTIMPHDVPIFGDLTYYLAVNLSNQVSPKSLTTLTVGPGFRNHLGNNWYLLGALTAPVTGPHPYDEAVTLWILKTF